MITLMSWLVCAAMLSSTAAEDVSSATAELNNRPIIGVLTQELTPDLADLYPEQNFTIYVPASYVKFVEAGGARAAPVWVYESPEYYGRMFNSLNGLLLPGGDSQLDSDGFGTAAKAFWDLAKQNPDVYFPIWGTCQGLEELAFLAGGGDVITACNASNQAVSVVITPDALQESRILANAPSEIVEMLTVEQDVVMFHYNCVTPENLNTTGAMEDFNVIATSDDQHGINYVAMMEHRRLPFYGVQFHPEKNVFEWSTLSRVDQIPHNAHAVLLEQYLANFFVNETRRNFNTFSDPAEEQAALFYNYPTYYTATKGSSFETLYYF